MSTLMLMLTVAMAVPGNGPEKVSGEIPEEKPLFTENWEGDWRAFYRSHLGCTASAAA